MEEIYILSDGSQVDLSGYSQKDRLKFLINNPGAKKTKGVAKSADVAPKNNQAQKNVTGSSSTTGFLGSQKLRLPEENDLETMQKRGLVPPPSAQPKSRVDVNNLYGSPIDAQESYNKDYNSLKKTLNPTVDKNFRDRVKGIQKVEKTKSIEDTYDLKKDSVERVTSIEDVQNIRKKIEETDSNLEHPYLYYSSINPENEQDDFVKNNYNTKELENLGINVNDFEGYLNKKGYKLDYLNKLDNGLFGESSGDWNGYDANLGKEIQQNKMLNMYMEDMKRRDITKQDLNQEIEVIQGVRKDKEIKQNELFYTQGVSKYIEKNYPILTQKLKDRDIENKRIYDESISGGTDFFSWETPEKMLKQGWNAVSDRVSQLSASAYESLGMKDTAEGIRMLNEENQLVRPDTRDVSYVSGQVTNYQGKQYIVDSKGEIYDKENKIRVTDIFNKDAYDKIVEGSKYGSSDFIFSTQGAAVQTSGVMADMLVQAMVTRGVGKLGTIGAETRAALNIAKPTTKFTSIFNDTSKLLKTLPLQRSTGYSMIAQGALGYSQGFEDTLKAARDNGITDDKAFELATAASQRMAILYATTGPINPQTKLVENIFGSKNIIKKAIEQYTKTGAKGFIKYFDDIIKNTPRNVIEFAEEGGKEVIQENLQQVGEVGVNMMTNQDAGKKIMNEAMSGDDFMNTSILSFISSGLISKIKIPSLKPSTKSQHVDDLRSLSTLAKNKKEFTKMIDGLVDRKVFTFDQATTLKNDVDIYANNVNKITKNISPEAAMPIMRELDKITKLTDEKQTVDKAFHPQIDEKIESIRQKINDIQYESDLKVKNEAISNAIKKGVAKGVEMKTFSSDEQVRSYLMNELNMSKEDADDYVKETGFALNATTLRKYSKDPKSIADNKQIIVVNESASRDAGVIQHEFLHGLLQKTLNDNPEAQKLLGVALTDELFKIQNALQKKGSEENIAPIEFLQKLGKYLERNQKDKAREIAQHMIRMEQFDGDASKMAAEKAKHADYLAKLDGVMWEEAIIVYSDALRNGYVTYNESTFTKLGDVIRRVLQQLGLKDIKFESGRDVYNFVKDYNRSIETGNWGKAITKMSNKGAKINIKGKTNQKLEASKPKEGSTFTTAAKFSLSEKKSSENIKKDVNKNYDKEKWSVGSNSKGENPAIDRVLFDVLGEYDYIIKGKARALRYDKLPGYTEDDSDMIAETKIALIPHIRNFNKEFFQKREEYKKELEDQGLDPKSQEFKDKVEAQDEKGYKGKKGIVKENNDLNAWINSQLVNKMGNALRSGNVTTKVFTEDIEGEGFKETRVLSDYAGDTGEESDFLDESDNIFDAEQDFEDEQNRLAVLLSDPVFRFTDEQGKPLNIETVPFGTYVTEITDPTIAANKKLKTETDPNKIIDLKRQLKELERGLELQNKSDLTYEEKEELKGLKSFKSYDLSSGMMINTFEALSVEDTPARIISDQVGREILRSPNIETLEYRNFKERLSDMSKTMARRMTFKNGPEIESFMYDNWKLLYDVINHPVDPVTGESSYASKKLPPTLKEFDKKGNIRKIKNITRVKFLQAFYEVDNVRRIIKTYGGSNANAELKQLEPVEVNPQTGKPLSQNAHFDRRTALMELFGDVLVLQEARRLLRQPEFLDRVAERNVNLYNSLKDDVIRAGVLSDMAKGKSDIVKFTLRQTEEPLSITETSAKYNSIAKIQEALTNGIANNMLYSPESLPTERRDIIKFSLSEVLSQKSGLEGVESYRPSNKKYLNNFTDIFDIEELGDIEWGDAGKNYYIKALEYSDVVDDGINNKKLHTLKNYEEVETEVVDRLNNLFNLMMITPRMKSSAPKIDPNSELGRLIGLKEGQEDNPFLIQEYKESYIDKMLQQSIDNDDQQYIDYWTAIKNDEEFREKDIYEKRVLQYEALTNLVTQFRNTGSKEIDVDTGEITLTYAFHNGIPFSGLEKGVKSWNENSTVKTENPNNLRFNPFFTYLFLNDVLSNRYVSNVNTETSERKPFKRSEYKTTLQPVDSYQELLIDDVYRDFSHIELKYPAFVYSFLKLQANKNYDSEWDTKRKVLDYNNNKIFKFKQSDEDKDYLSLNALAARNTEEEAEWCTGTSDTMAKNQLSNGDFFISTDNNTKPNVAVRLDERKKNGIGEVVGVEPGQSFDLKEIPTIVEIFKLSDVKQKERYIKAIQAVYDLISSGKINSLNNNPEQNSELIRDIKKLKNNSLFRFELIKEYKDQISSKLSPIQNKLEDAGLLSGNLKLIDLVDDDGNIEVDQENYYLLEEVEDLTEDLEIQDDDYESDFITIRETDSDGFDYNLPNLQKIGMTAFLNVRSFNAPNLTEGLELNLEGEQEYSDYFIKLGETSHFNIIVKVELTNEANIFTLSEDTIDLGGMNFNLTTSFKVDRGMAEEEGTSIDIEYLENVEMVEISGLADTIFLPNKISDLNFYPDRSDSVYKPKNIFITGLKEVDYLSLNIDGQEGEKIDSFTFADAVSIGKTFILFKEQITDKLIESVLKSEIGIYSKEIQLRNSYYDEQGEYVYVETTIKSPDTERGEIKKFSLAEENNGNLSPFLEGLPFTEQWVVARDIDNAFEKAKMSTNTEIDFQVPDLSDMTDKGIAYFIISKAAEGYNNFEFLNQDNSKGPLTKQVLNTIDVKSEEYKKNRDRINNIEKTINDFIETNKGIASDETFSPETAKNLGKNIGKHDIYLPPEDEDFEGLLYTLATAKGKEGQMQLDFLRETLLKPYSDAMLNLMKARQTMYKDWRDLINKKYKGISKELKQDSGYGGYLIDQAVRVYLWNSAPYPIPGLDKKDLFHLNEIVRTNPRLRAFAADVSLLSKQANGYVEPDSNWGFGSVVGDINNVISKSNRKKYLEPWIKNIDKAFSKDNLSKIEAIYGRKYVIALKNTLDRMKTGSNRSEGASDKFLNWLNGSTAVTMFANIRSAVLQLLGAVNYINTTDNNILKAGAALANVPQYMQDVKTIWNSDYLKDRRSGLMNDVAEAELAQVMNDPRNKSVLDKFKAANYWVLKMGYAPTRFADSLAIAFGGAAFYRNRLNTYLKQGNTQEEAERLTQRDFYQVSEQSQQSADVSKISMNQASVKGRLILAFQNTPLQYSRLIKRSVIDLAKGRGSVPNNVAKIVYYGAIQNMMFNFLQNGLFSLLWDDEEEQQAGKFDSAKIRAVSGTMDSLLRGSGLNGALIATVKNAFIKWYEKSGDPKGYGDVGLELANVAPSIGIKLRAGAKAYKAIEYNMDEIKYKGFSLDNQYAIEAATSLTSATTNFPADRLMTKINNVSNALNEENEPWQRIFSLLGYTKYNLGIEDGSGGVDTRSKLKVPELKAPELKIPVLK